MQRVRLFGMEIDPVGLGEAVARVLAWTDDPRGGCRYVVTPNVDHVVLFQEHAGLRAAYDRASLVTADGWPVVWASRLLGRALPDRVAGSDLAPALFAEAQRQGRLLRVYLLGAGPGVGERAAARIEQEWPVIDVVGTCSPPLGFERDEGADDRILQAIAAARPDVLLVGLGAPKQELWVSRHADAIAASAALCVGATIDFLAGEKRRAPRWMQRGGLEWLHRLSSEPGRLLSRYLKDARRFPPLVWRQWRDDRRSAREAVRPA